MKKTKRQLKRSITYILLIITMMLGTLWISIDDFDIHFIPVYLLGWIIIALLSYILYEYGNKKVLYDNK